MFHWGRGSSYSGYETDWKHNNDILGMKSQQLVDHFACQVIQNFRCDQVGKVQTEILENFSVFPGCVLTEAPYDQRAHIDMDSWGIIVHMPLSEEGLMIYIWPENPTRTQTGQLIHVPFGSFLALRAHSLHSGLYGHNGILRLHHLIIALNNRWCVDKLLI